MIMIQIPRCVHVSKVHRIEPRVYLQVLTPCRSLTDIHVGVAVIDRGGTAAAVKSLGMMIDAGNDAAKLSGGRQASSTITGQGHSKAVSSTGNKRFRMGQIHDQWRRTHSGKAYQHQGISPLL